MSNQRDREAKRQYNRSYTNILVQRRRTNGLCVNCGKPARAGKSQCQECSEYQTKRLVERRKAHKKRAVEYLGGQCLDCGLRSELVEIYDFHHRSADEKESSIARLLDRTKNWGKICEELDKCVLLCSNCHRIRHAREDGNAHAPPKANR